MIKLEQLKTLEKNSNVELCYCDYISDKQNEKENIRTRILFDKKNEKYYFHKMQNGKVIECFEIALSWKPFENCMIFAYTPDDIHIYEIDSRNPETYYHDVKKIGYNQDITGMSCTYDDITIQYVNETELKINGKSISGAPATGFVYKLLKTKIKAEDGARGLFVFLENIAETSKIKLPLFNGVYDKIKELYIK